MLVINMNLKDRFYCNFVMFQTKFISSNVKEKRFTWLICYLIDNMIDDAIRNHQKTFYAQLRYIKRAAMEMDTLNNYYYKHFKV